MKTKLKTIFILSLLTFFLSSLSFGQTDREWWDNLSPAWKKIFQEQELKGKDIDPNDEQLERIIRVTHIDCSQNKDIKNLKPLSRLILLEEIRCDNTNIESLEGIEELSNLKRLDCSDNDNINSLAPLTSLSSLEDLDCSNTMIKNLAPLQALTNLKKLDVHFCTVNKLLQISKLTQLEELDVSDNKSLYDIQGTERLRNLIVLNLSGTRVRDLKPISFLQSIRVLDLSGTSIETLKEIQDLKNLTEINCSNTNITAVSLDYLYSHISLKMIRARDINSNQPDIDRFIKLYKSNNPNCTLIISPKLN